MKKKLLLAFCLALSMMVVGCNGKESKEEAEKKVSESAEKIGKKITCGEFVFDGVVYKFPMDLKQWLDNGWHVSNNYDNKDEFKLEPGATSNEFELFNEDEDYVRVSVMNTKDEDAKIEDCMVYTLYMSTAEGDLVLPGGITKSSKPDDVLKAYGDPISKGDEKGLLEATYYYEDEDAWKCYVEVDVVDNSFTIDPLSSVRYSIESFGSIWDSLVASEGIEKTCEIFLDATMKTCYWGDFKSYLEYGIDSQSGADELYQSEYVYFSECLMYYAGIDSSWLSAETIARVDKVAIDVLKKVKWNIKGIEANAFEEGTVTLELYPTNFFDVIEEDIIKASNDFSLKYDGVDFDSMSDEEYAVIEEEYADAVIKVMESKVSEAGTLEAIVKEYELDTDNAIVSEDAWIEIDDTIMDLVE